jgi:hypothetical protein
MSTVLVITLLVMLWPFLVPILSFAWKHWREIVCVLGIAGAVVAFLRLANKL